jgi:hypothetical protein
MKVKLGGRVVGEVTGEILTRWKSDIQFSSYFGCEFLKKKYWLNTILRA